MKEKLLTLLSVVLFVSVIMLLVGAAHEAADQEELKQEVLHKQAEKYRQIVKETHQLYQAKQMPTFCIDTEMTPREMLWHMERAIGKHPDIKIYGESNGDQIP